MRGPDPSLRFASFRMTNLARTSPNPYGRFRGHLACLGLELSPVLPDVQKKGPTHAAGPFRGSVLLGLAGDDVGRARALFALSDVKGDRLILIE